MLSSALVTLIFAAGAGLQPAAPTGLTDAQQQMLKSAQDGFQAQIQPLAEKLANTARELNRVLLADKPDADLERKLGDQLGAAVAEVVTGAIRIRVAALHDLVATLTPEQRKLLLAEMEKPGANPDLLELIKKVWPAKRN